MDWKNFIRNEIKFENKDEDEVQEDAFVRAVLAKRGLNVPMRFECTYTLLGMETKDAAVYIVNTIASWNDMLIGGESHETKKH